MWGPCFGSVESATKPPGTSLEVIFYLISAYSWDLRLGAEAVSGLDPHWASPMPSSVFGPLWTLNQYPLNI